MNLDLVSSLIILGVAVLSLLVGAYQGFRIGARIGFLKGVDAGVELTKAFRVSETPKTPTSI
jgi:hypothetical protein